MLTCPNCEKVNNCSCNTCQSTENLVIILEDEELYQCCFCGHKFHEQDLVDYGLG
jgi:hypothetical protein